jgi:hypothetical protein
LANDRDRGGGKRRSVNATSSLATLANLHHSLGVILTRGLHREATRPRAPSAKPVNGRFGHPGIFVGLDLPFARLVFENLAQLVDIFWSPAYTTSNLDTTWTPT